MVNEIFIFQFKKNIKNIFKIIKIKFGKLKFKNFVKGNHAIF